MRIKSVLLFVMAICSITLFASGDTSGADSGHHDPFARVFEFFFLILFLALIGRFASKKLNQSAVLGELLIGIIAGAILYPLDTPVLTVFRNFEVIEEVGRMVTQENVNYTAAIDIILTDADLKPEAASKLRNLFIEPDLREYLIIANSIRFISSLGIILLLFMVGLEISISDMKKSGRNSFIVAVLGVILPFAFGYFVSLWLLPQLDDGAHIFVAATLCATSIGITARVFKDLHKLYLPEAKIVLGAAVLDDILGLIILAVVTGVVTTGAISVSEVIIIFVKAIVFFAAILWFGSALLKRTVKLFARFDRAQVKLLYPFALLMICAYLADLVGLATIVGAFAAGLIIREEAFQLSDTIGISSKESLEVILTPLEGIFAPVFFVVMGLQVDTSLLFTWDVLMLGGILTVAAILGKWLAGLPLRKGLNKNVIGFGMVPRGEVGLIFAGIGKSIGVLDNKLFAAVILVVLLTTVITPPILVKLLKK
ncbi:cation:proton antiporter [Cryomorphaceae bacterium 1068]|nr:cation:proton antiporter [Cryomorphaceae bacterium 1068]